MIDFKLYLDLGNGLPDGSGYFEIEAVSIGAFTEGQIDEMPVMRKSWGDIIIRNDPFRYARLGEDKYKLYDIITSLPANKEIHIKFVSNFETIEGYFGITDCKLDDDNKNITIKAETLDQYTDLLENRETELSLFEANNQIKNGNFDSATHINLDNGYNFDFWDKNSDYLLLEQKYVNDNILIAISDRVILKNERTEINPQTGLYEYVIDDYPSGKFSIYQTVTNVLKGQQANLSFLWELIGLNDSKYDSKYNLAYDVFLYNRDNIITNYRLKDDGSWTDEMPITVSTNPIIYRSSAILGTMDKFNLKKYSLVTEPTPIEGSIVVKFYRYCSYGDNYSNTWEDGVYLYLRNIVLDISAITLKTVNIVLSDGSLAILPQGSALLRWDNKADNDRYFRVWVKNSEGVTIDSFIDSDGLPIMGELGNTKHAPTSHNSTTYQDLNSIFESNKIQDSYKFSMSKLTIYKGGTTDNLITSIFGGSNGRYFYATAEFSREEITKLDEFDDNDVIIEPALKSGWVYLGSAPDVNKPIVRKWVRIPYNDSIKTWTKGELDTSPSLRQAKDFGFQFYDSLTTTINYPTNLLKSPKISTAVDLREVIKQAYWGTYPSLNGKKILSTFFWNDNKREILSEEDSNKLLHSLHIDEGRATTHNYVTMESPNVLNNMFAIHTSDLATEVLSNPESYKLKLSFKKLIDNLRLLFPELYWFIDADKNLHLEHDKYFDCTSDALNLLVPKYNFDYSKWEYDNSKMFSTEEYTMKNAGFTDFANSTITYDKIVSNKRGQDIKANYAIDLITTDVQYCIENRNSLDNGLLLVCCDIIDDEYKTRNGKGQKSRTIVVNGDISIASALSDYASYMGTWETGRINGFGSKGTDSSNDLFNFSKTKRTRKGAEISIPGIITANVVLTKLGLGLIKDKTIDYINEITSFTAVYRHKDNIISIGDNNFLDLGDTKLITTLLPEVFTDTYILFTDGIVRVMGRLTSDGGGTISAMGICYGQSSIGLDIIGDKIVYPSILIGNYKIDITADADVQYYYRAFATNDIGTSYGTIRSFTARELANMEDPVIAINDYSVSVNSKILAGYEVSERGICWSSGTTPTINDNKLQSGSGIGSYTNSFTNTITGTYYLRSYAINTAGVSYSHAIPFTITIPF